MRFVTRRVACPPKPRVGELTTACAQPRRATKFIANVGVILEHSARLMSDSTTQGARDTDMLTWTGSQYAKRILCEPGGAASPVNPVRFLSRRSNKDWPRSIAERIQSASGRDAAVFLQFIKWKPGFPFSARPRHAGGVTRCNHVPINRHCPCTNQWAMYPKHRVPVVLIGHCVHACRSPSVLYPYTSQWTLGPCFTQWARCSSQRRNTRRTQCDTGL